MKIICPQADCGRSFDNEQELLYHLLSYITEKEKLSYIRKYVRMLFKTHEKIESLEKENLGRGHLRKCIEHIESLLEPEK